LDLSFNHAVIYSNKGTVPVPDIARSLLATEHLATEYLPRLLERLFEGLTVQALEVELRHVQHESPLTEKYLFKLAVVFQERLEKYITALGDKTGFAILKDNRELLSLLIILLVLYGAQYASKLVSPDKPAVHIEGNNNSVLVAAGDVIGIPPAQLQQIISEVLASHRDQKAVASNAVDIVAPAKREPGAIISTISETPGGAVMIDRSAITEVPDRATLESLEPDEWTETLESVTINIRATDRDHAKSGWAVMIPSVSERRIRMQIVPGIDLDQLARHEEVRGDVIVSYRRQQDGTARATGAHLYRLHQPEKPGS
jgi:hypothetical protein